MGSMWYVTFHNKSSQSRHVTSTTRKLGVAHSPTLFPRYPMFPNWVGMAAPLIPQNIRATGLWLQFTSMSLWVDIAPPCAIYKQHQLPHRAYCSTPSWDKCRAVSSGASIVKRRFLEQTNLQYFLLFMVYIFHIWNPESPRGAVEIYSFGCRENVYNIWTFEN